MTQMAATAGGVAIGSAVGHTIDHTMTGKFSGSNSKKAVPVPQQSHGLLRPRSKRRQAVLVDTQHVNHNTT
ncbi:conserved hypothetical protein [Culex quinquefasciatus]|uniref:Uncharacterized protein n=1 Tax=Culex quinquefasciatus TaxID=7176 RepID=B0XK90_CULQU|nr:conserved hypothetical protein [Culex quinquefasciatus]|eukprot:XP_001870062.1 conserved hypothetical protein [Culex quinquefasciatus]